MCLEADDNVFEMEVESRDVLSALDVQELMNGRFQVIESDEEGEECEDTVERDISTAPTSVTSTSSKLH